MNLRIWYVRSASKQIQKHQKQKKHAQQILYFFWISNKAITKTVKEVTLPDDNSEKAIPLPRENSRRYLNKRPG